MPISRKSIVLCRVAMSAALGFLTTSVAATPAHADSVRSRQWHLDAMRADEMWKTSTGRGITVAVIDSGVDGTIADLRGQVQDGKDFSSLPGDEHTDRANHGTGMAALIAGTGARGETAGSYGLAPDAKILPIRMAYGSERSRQGEQLSGYSRDMAKAIRYAADSHAQILNISMAAANHRGFKNVDTPELTAAVKYALTKGKLIFAGVGNDAAKGNPPMYPAATPGVVGVGAIDREIKRTEESQWGPQVDMVAPGDDIWNACTGGTKVCSGHGTSASTALASASAALIWSKHPGWTNNQVLRVMINTMQGNDAGWSRDDSVGYGAVRPRIALKNPGDPGPADEYPLPDLAAAAKSPSPTASRSDGSAGSTKKDGKPASAAITEDDDSSTVWLALGLSAAALLGAAIAMLTLRARRRTTSQRPYPDTSSNPYPYQAPSSAIEPTRECASDPASSGTYRATGPSV